MDLPPKFSNFTIGPQTQVDRRKREIQILINVAEPDPEYQPFGFTDEASITDAVGVEPEDIQRRFDAYFRERLDIPLQLPLWRFVDAVKVIRPDWPEDG